MVVLLLNLNLMASTCWIHFLWYTFYGQFEYLDTVIKYYLDLQSTDHNMELNGDICWDNDYLCIKEWKFLITGILWDMLILLFVFKRKKSNHQSILDY